MPKIILKETLVICCFLFFTLVNRVSAAEMSIKSAQSNFAIGSSFSVEINIDTENQSVNAIEGELTFDDRALELKEIKDGNSQINFWVDKPDIISPGKVFFSGITPGGLMGKDRFLFSLVFSPKKTGLTSIVLNNLKVLKNDGQGTKLNTPDQSLNITVSNKAPQAFTSSEDQIKPEDFKIYIGQDKEIFSGQSFVVFSTQDKNSGIDHYEVKEGFWSDYSVEKSPYLLKNQSLSKTIYVKAVDKDGNERIVSFNPRGDFLPYRWYLLLGILLVACIVTFRKIKLKFSLR